MFHPEKGNIQAVLRRRRTRRHQRNRLIRRSLAAAALAVLVVSVSALALLYLGPSFFHGQQSAIHSAEPSGNPLNAAGSLNEILAEARPSRPVYPYSVVAGGVEDAKELKWVAEHDPIVGAHYAGFDYAHARVVRLTLARTAFLSYRIGNHIYWTRRRITLRKGEKVITDGRMTARTRCANRVEETPQQQAVSPAEPPAQRFDEPVRPGEGIAMQSPEVPFESAFVTRPQMPGFEPVGPLSLYDPFVGGSFIPLSPPPLPSGLCAPAKAKGKAAASGGTGKKKKAFSCEISGGGPEPVPEPGTWALFITGLAVIYWHARRKSAKA